MKVWICSGKSQQSDLIEKAFRKSSKLFRYDTFLYLNMNDKELINELFDETLAMDFTLIIFIGADNIEDSRIQQVIDSGINTLILGENKKKINGIFMGTKDLFNVKEVEESIKKVEKNFNQRCG